MTNIEKVEVFGWEAAIRGMRNPMNSWSKSDSKYENGKFVIGDADLDLMKRLSASGPDHAKFMRFINVTADIIAPQYFDAELDTYKVGTVRNSCSLQHKGMSRPFTIKDFSVPEKIYEILDYEKEKKNHPLVYTDSEKYKIYTISDRNYKVFENGKIISCEYNRKHELDNRTRHFKEYEVKPSQNKYGYYELHLGGKKHTERWLLHRLVAKVWLQDIYFSGAEVNHKDGNKGNNAIDNLEWVTHKENEIHKRLHGLSGRTIHTDYLAWKNSSKINIGFRNKIIQDYQMGMKQIDIATKYDISQPQVSAIIRNDFCKNNELFVLSNVWENTIDAINELRLNYINTNDEMYFKMMRQLIPMGYNYKFTWQGNYAVLKNMYHARKSHKLDEWKTFCEWIETLPHAKELICIGK